MSLRTMALEALSYGQIQHHLRPALCSFHHEDWTRHPGAQSRTSSPDGRTQGSLFGSCWDQMSWRLAPLPGHRYCELFTHTIIHRKSFGFILIGRSEPSDFPEFESRSHPRGGPEGW